MPDLNWKARADYQKAIENEVISPEWVQGIDLARQDVLSRLENRSYPYDGSWLNWMPDPTWTPHKLPENWDKIKAEP